MAYIPREEKAEDLKNISIYAICFPNDRKVFVWKSLSHNLRCTYKDHFTGHCKATQDMVTSIQESGLLPHMYLLSEVYTIHRLAYNHCVAWARYFKDHGYEILPMKNIQTFADSLTATQLEIYSTFEHKPLNEVCTNLYPNYRSTKKHENPRIQTEGKRKCICVPLSTDELEALDRAVAASGKSRAAYCRERILCGSMVHVDHSLALGVYHTILDCHNLIKQIMRIIYTQGNYGIGDLTNLQRLVDAILLSADEIYASYTNTSQTAMQGKI